VGKGNGSELTARNMAVKRAEPQTITDEIKLRGKYGKRGETPTHKEAIGMRHAPPERPHKIGWNKQRGMGK
jgi:hypothetical protein